MIAIRVKTASGTKDMQFEDHDKGNAWAKKLFDILGRSSEFRPRKLDGSIMTVHSEMSFRELHDKGMSFFGAVSPMPLKRTAGKTPERPKRPKSAGKPEKKTN